MCLRTWHKSNYTNNIDNLELEKILEFLQDKFFSSKKEDKIYEQVIDELLDRNILNKEDIDEIQNGYYSNEKDNEDLEL